MKKFLYLATVLCAGLTIASCSKDEDEPTVQQPETPATATVDFEGEYWTNLIDNPQYGGALLYGANGKDYTWTDEKTTLTGAINQYDPWSVGISYSSGGTAISNYVSNDFAQFGNFNYQLTIPVSNGSDNFAVVYCNSDTQAPAEGTTNIFFKDGKQRVIKSMQIGPTTYELGAIDNGINAASLKESGFLTLIITADNGKKVDVDLAKDGTLLTTWKTVDLSSLGAVKKLSFTMDGSDKLGGYLNSPAYFAFDNVVVEL